MEMKTPDGSITVTLNMIGFVDDSTMITSGHPSISEEELLERIQHDAQLWHDLLWTSGGNLELEKCGYHCVFYKYDENDQPVMQQEVKGKIELKTSSGKVVPIDKKIFTSQEKI